MSVDIIICNYNGEKIISDCLSSVKEQTYKDWACTVVDDCSIDESIAYIKKHFPFAGIITKDQNSGPSISRNMGIAQTKNEYIAILDNDVVLDKNWLKEQVAFLETHPYCYIAGSKLVFAHNPKKLNSSYGGMFTFGIGFDGGAGKPSTTFSTPKQSLYVCSAAMLVRRSLITAIGGFDETYFYGHEDTDLGWRANIAGYSVWGNPAAVARHKHSETMKSYSSRVYYHSRKNYIRSVLKNYEIKNIIWALPTLLFFLGCDVLLKGHKTAKLKGILWSLWHLLDTFKERRKVQNTRAVRDQALWRLMEPWHRVFKT